MYPNPSNGIIYLNWNKEVKNGQVKIYNVSGQNVYVENTQNITNDIVNLHNQSKGIYYIQVTDNNNSWTEKIILK